MKLIYLISSLVLFSGCHLLNDEKDQVATSNEEISIKPDTTVYTKPSRLKNEYKSFNSRAAINEIAEMENFYFRNYQNGITPYYGTIWRENLAVNDSTLDSPEFIKYCNALEEKPDSMHCTLYAVKALKAGLPDSLWKELEDEHLKTYGSHEHAGWSIGHILVEKFGWKAYLIIEESCQEFSHCKKSFDSKRTYPVWGKPDIPLQDLFIKGKDNLLIENLLNENEFGWGFSYQGWHTWVTRFSTLKECIWYGAPSKSFESGYSAPLFKKTPFIEYYDYGSHVVIFPPKALEN